ncbi:T9SS type B sorting domain-containing protein, partial [Microcystis aeruginosa]|uniref:T9SS type B sorting domain-containing protein n=1 Tax=Microcystis aeruginosa TaxID=1126 RepID=UPI000AB74353
LTQCDEDGTNDGQTTFDLTSFTSIIIGTNNPAGVEVYYYDSQAALTADLAETPRDYGDALTAAQAEAYQTTTPFSQTLYAIVVNPATSSGCPSETSFTLTVNPLPEPEPNDGTICVNDEGILVTSFTIFSNLDPSTHTFEWYNSSDELVGTEETYTATAAGVYTVVATNIATGCQGEASATIIESERAQVTVTTTNAFSDNQSIIVTATGVGTYVYQLNDGPFQESNIFTNLQGGTYTITVRDINGCEDVVVTVDLIDYPPFFTPNGDGFNDTWNVIGLSDQPGVTINIFDRYGKLIKQISPSGEGWDGNYNGQPLPSTDYWFTVEYFENEQRKEFKAHFSLKR